MKKLSILLVLVVMAGGAFGQSNFGTGQWLHDGWQASQKTVSTPGKEISDVAQEWEYGGFVFGAARVMDASQWIDIPATVTFGQWLAVVGKYLDDHPEEWNLNAEVLVYRGLHAVWPGRKTPER
jgi:hypothetical protein